MAALSAEHMALLKGVLVANYVAHVPPLLSPSNVAEKNAEKNLSRSFNGFAVSKICAVTEATACASIVDDFDDVGIDAIFYDAITRTLYFAQGKLKEGAMFSQEEAESLCRGVRKIIQGDFTGFNTNVMAREVDIRGALENCDHIEIVVAHTGEGISNHADAALKEFLADQSHGDERLASAYVDFDAEKVVQALLNAQAFQPVDAIIDIECWNSMPAPRTTYFGLIPVSRLVQLHNQHGEALYEKNIRTFLGKDTTVNTSIQQTLNDAPENFVFLNNGVTILCTVLEPKSNLEGVKKLDLKGISVINGAQTIASAATFVAENGNKDISDSRVSITVVQIDAGDDFGQLVTQARNHQNAVYSGDFVALDPQQERLRREIAYLGITYVYKAVGANRVPDSMHIYVDEAAQALTCLHNDVRSVAILKKRPGDALDRQNLLYKELFSDALTGNRLANSVRCNRYIQGRMNEESAAAGSSREQATYRNGNFLLSWILMRRLTAAIDGVNLIDEAKIRAELAVPFDELRQILFEETEKLIGGNSHSAFFKNQAQVMHLAKVIMIRCFGIVVDGGMLAFEEANPGGYVQELARRAPQIDLS